MSIRLKFIFTILLMLFISIGASLYFAVSLYKEDKTSYIFESSLQSVKLISKEVENIVATATYNAQIFSRLSSAGFEIDENLMELKSEFLLYSYSKKKEQKISLNPNLEKIHSIEKSKIEKAIQNFPKYSESLAIDNLTEYLGIPSIGIFLRNSFSEERFVYVVSLGQIIDSLNKRKGFQDVLFDSKGKIFTSNKKIDNEVIDEVLKSKNISSSSFSQNKEKLFSFVKLPHYNMNIATILPREEAFKASFLLIERLVSVGLVLLGVSILIGVFLSSNITKPIIKLAESSEYISEGNYGAIVELKDKGEIGILTSAFNHMSLKIQETVENLIDANQQLDYMNKNLEKLVAQRTRELREANNYLDAMINSFDQGLLVFDQNFKCNPVYTKVCEKHFETKPGGKNFLDVINIVEEEKRKVFDRWKENLFTELIPFESIAELGPESFVIDEGGERFKKISLKYFPMRNESEAVENIVVVATDSTAQEVSKERLQKEKDETARIVNIIENKEQFMAFLSDFEAMNNYLAKISHESETISSGLVKSLLHTMKGTAGVYHLSDIYQYIDKIEEKYQDKPDSDFESEVLTDLKLLNEFITERFNDLKSNLKVFLGDQLVDGVRRYEKRFDHILSMRKKFKTEDVSTLARLFDKYFFRIEAKQLLKGYSSVLQDLAVTLGKDVDELEIVGGDIRIHPTYYEKVFNTFIHILRNIVDHGIEEPYLREKLNKNEKGKVKIEVSIKEKELLLDISDDGRGIDLNKIRTRMEELGYDQSIIKKEDSEIVNYIFDEGFSTKQISTDISGRGVGLFAVKLEIAKIKGTISVESSEGKGTRFKLRMPYA